LENTVEKCKLKKIIVRNSNAKKNKYIYFAEVIFLISAKTMNVGRILYVTTCPLILISEKVENLKGPVIIGGCAIPKRVWDNESIP